MGGGTSTGTTGGRSTSAGTGGPSAGPFLLLQQRHLAQSPTKSTHTPIPSAMRSHHHGDQMAPAVATPSRSKGTRDGGGGCVGEGKSRVAVTPLIVNTLEPVAAASWAGVME